MLLDQVRVPAPCQYAHKLALLVGDALHKVAVVSFAFFAIVRSDYITSPLCLGAKSHRRDGRLAVFLVDHSYFLSLFSTSLLLILYLSIFRIHILSLFLFGVFDSNVAGVFHLSS